MSEPEYDENVQHREIPFETTEEGRKLLIAKEICIMLMRECQTFNKLILDTRGFSRSLSIQSVDYISIPNLPNAINCLINLTKFVCGGEFFKGEIFHTMANYCYNLDSISIVDTFHPAINELANLILVQRNLRKFNWIGGYGDLTPIIISFSSQFEYLEEIQLANAFFQDFKALEGLANCQNLEILKIAECHLTSLHVKPLVNVNFPHLKILEITDIHDAYDFEQEEAPDPPSEEIISIIRNANRQLRDVRLNLELHFYPGIIETVGISCPNLQTFAANIKTDEQVSELMNLLSSCRQLENLIICGYSWSNFFPADYILPEIGAILPKMLTHLDLTKWTFEAEALRKFLKNCKSSLEYMSWHCFISHEEHKSAIVEYSRKRGIGIKNLRVDVHDSGYGWHRCVCHISVEFEKSSDTNKDKEAK
ncbi:10267_t:CDS:1 [Diversispora eburnea]|uniref:10267_t:CDS:1 n=1 Tax=Diversispora eburnea TaxID=1213867 RepID=A0A9N8Z2N2_9GLOM|nr:10267_t:CDS:1 [Diversispora eburnea]